MQNLKQPVDPKVAEQPSKPAPALPDEEKLKATLEQALSPIPADPAAAVAQQATPRRDDHEAKTFAAHRDPDVKQETLAAAIAAQALDKKGEQTFNFMSRFPSLVIYVNTGAQEREKGGEMIRRDTPVQFKNGVFQTTDKKLAALIRMHPQCNTQIFRETVSEEMFHLRKAAAARGAATRSPTFAGATASSDGGELGLLNQQRVFEDIENRIMSGVQ